MGKKIISWKTKGMNKDMSVSSFNPEFAFENINMRLATNEGNTMMSWVNEKGVKRMRLHIDMKPWMTVESADRYSTEMEGMPLGTAVLNHKLVVFTTTTYDRIYVFEKSGSTEYDLIGKMLFEGHLGFNVKNPIETLVSFESKDIQKVYWTDGLNQPRVINIAPSKDDNTSSYNNNSFDFVQELALKEEVKVVKLYGSGEFPPGVIQYAFTYYNKYGQESNIFYTTPLQYISYIDRGGSPEDKVANAFRIKVSNVDRNFEYMRIYSIMRTSLNGTPVVKRIQDIKIVDTTLTFIDNGLQGETIDPTELLFKGGEEIRAKTLEQKDGTLFLGNVAVTRPQISIKSTLLSNNGVSKSNPLANDNVSAILSNRQYKITSKKPFVYLNTLDSSDESYQGAACFKSREYYRLGVQFQYKNGKWSEPCWIGDKRCNVVPIMDEGSGLIGVPEFRYTLEGVFVLLSSQGYKKVRPVFAIPGSQDKTILCQGIGAPTMYRQKDREGNLYGISSWLFRTPRATGGDWNVPNVYYTETAGYNGGGFVTSEGKLKSQFEEPYLYSGIVSPYLSSTEVMGNLTDKDSFYVDTNLITINSPDIELDNTFSNSDFKGYDLNTVGYTTFDKTYGDISIQMSTPTIGSDAGGFVHRSIVAPGSAALISGLFFNDYIVDDERDSNGKLSGYGAYHTSSPAVDFPIFMWHKNGSLNNDVSRNGRSAELMKKKISNYRLGWNTVYASVETIPTLGAYDIQLFNNDELAVVKVNGHTYQGNVDTMITPSEPSPYYFSGNPWRKTVDTDYKSKCYYKLALKDPNDTSSRSGVWELKSGTWSPAGGKESKDIGDCVKGLDQWREGVSIKYKSTPHLVAQTQKGIYQWTRLELAEAQAPIIEVYRDYDSNIMYGGTSDEALQAATWIPCGPPVSFGTETRSLQIEFKWGDTYFQRFECLKTYPFTKEDKNQVVEIASFMCETRVNIDGRYDRNRAQVSNLNMSPENFNLVNPVYSQMDNFFNYKILDKDSYSHTDYPNTVTWTKTKQNGADTDQWTNITMANTLEMDGDKGSVNKLVRMNNQLLAFQDSGIAQILYNENTQISTTEGVPIEIANSQKVQGKRYYSDTVGCSNNKTVVQTPMGIYFIDSNDKSIYLFNGQLANLSVAGGFNSWSKQNIPAADVAWTPNKFNNFVAYYDKKNQDVLFINKNTALAYSERFGCFTSFYDYKRKQFLNSLDDIGIWTTSDGLWQHQAGDYCNFFGVVRPFSMTLVGNQEPYVDKVFTNLEFRACVSEEGEYDESTGKFTPALPFDTIEVWNEYQHGLMSLSNRNSGDRFTHGTDKGLLIRKFRMWRCDIPRDNAMVSDEIEAPMGIKRFKARPLDRIRNPWAYIKLSKNKEVGKVEVHDVMGVYFG